MKRTRTTQVQEYIGRPVRLQGWLHAVRRLGGLAFVVLRDGWGTVQIVAGPQAREQVKGLGRESVIEVEGTVQHNPEAPGGAEVVEPTIRALVRVEEGLPVALGKSLGKAKLPAILDHAATTWRDPRRRAVAELASGVMAGFRATLMGQGFTEIQTPKLVGSASEGGANLFALDYFGARACLAQSPQMYKQIMVGVFERVFEVGPVFRAEPHATVRHLSEYVSLDVELGFINDHHDVIRVLRAVLAGIVDHLRTHHGAALERLAARLPSVPTSLPIVDFGDAHGQLGTAEPLPEDLSPQDERRLGDEIAARRGSAFLVVAGYPRAKRPFYTHPDPERPGRTNSFDLLFRGTELVTGGQRLHRHADVVAALQQSGLDAARFDSYLECFRYGMPPHGGFAVGLERFLAQLLGAANVREVALFPRDRSRLAP